MIESKLTAKATLMEGPWPGSRIEGPYTEAKADSNSAYILDVAKSFAKKNNMPALLLKDRLALFVSDFLRRTRSLTPQNYERDIKESKIMGGVEEFTALLSPAYAELLQFGDVDLLKMYFLLRTLNTDKNFKETVMKELKEDTADTTGEHGGRLVLNPSAEVSIHMIKNIAREDWIYIPAEKLYSLDMLVPCHFHALKVYDHYPAPSPPSAAGSDFGETEVVFTRIGENAFNVDIALTFSKNGKPVYISIDLGCYYTEPEMEFLQIPFGSPF
jgi:hypothetical protein